MLRSGAPPIPVIGSINGKPVFRALVQSRNGEFIVRDQYGNIQLIARKDGVRQRYFQASGKQVGYSEPSSGQTIRHYDTAEGAVRFIGHDQIVSDTRVRHYDASGAYLGETVFDAAAVSTESTILLAFVPAALAASAQCDDVVLWYLREFCRDPGLRAINERVQKLRHLLEMFQDPLEWDFVSRGDTAIYHACKGDTAPSMCLRRELLRYAEDLNASIASATARRPLHGFATSRRDEALAEWRRTERIGINY